jgi:hypothetical protein
MRIYGVLVGLTAIAVAFTHNIIPFYFILIGGIIIIGLVAMVQRRQSSSAYVPVAATSSQTPTAQPAPSTSPRARANYGWIWIVVVILLFPGYFYLKPWIEKFESRPLVVTRLSSEPVAILHFDVANPGKLTYQAVKGLRSGYYQVVPDSGTEISTTLDAFTQGSLLPNYPVRKGELWVYSEKNPEVKVYFIKSL